MPTTTNRSRYPLEPAPALITAEWLNTPRPLGIDDFRGRVLVIEAFQMLCPGCVAHGIPQAVRIAETFDSANLAVVGLHTVFEHHDVQGSRAALEAFVHEYRLPFPVAIDAPALDGGTPLTMRAYAMRGTPTLVVVDRLGRRRLQHFGQIDDLRLGAFLGALTAEPAGEARDVPDATASEAVAAAGHDDLHCDANGCAVPAP